MTANILPFLSICSGPFDAEIMIVGEAPGKEEIEQRQPFVGSSGRELSTMLGEAGIIRSACFITNCTSIRPPGNDIEHFFYKSVKEAKMLNIEPLYGRYPKHELRSGIDVLYRAIQHINPRLIIALGETALWALTGKSGITKWRGSTLPCVVPGVRSKVLATYHPAAILRMWSWRWIAVQDLRRAAIEASFDGLRDPGWRFRIRPSFEEVMEFLDDLLKRPRLIAEDIECYGGLIDCVAIATSKKEAFNIPFYSADRDHHSYWSFEEEKSIRLKLREVNTHPEMQIIWQNGSFDCQWFAKEEGYLPNLTHDTMVMHHVCFAGLPKRLDFQASLYCDEYVYWKDDGKLWNPKLHPQEQKWKYNCEDACRTYECYEKLQDALRAFNLQEQYNKQVQEILPAALRMMLRGVRVDHEFAKKADKQLEERAASIDEWFKKVLGHPLNVNSNPQMKALFHDDFGCKKYVHRDTGKPTLNDEALEKTAKMYPLLRPLILKIVERRSLRVFRSNFFASQTSPDGRMRCSFNIAATETYRWSSSEGADGTGTNLQNIPKDKPSKHKMTKGIVEMPNVRCWFIPDPDHTIVEVDLERADAQVVAWDADDPIMKQILREGRDLWSEAAREIYGAKFDHTDRQTCKQAGHATDYGASARTIAAYIGKTVHEAEQFQRKWFGLFKRIKPWQEEKMMQLMTRRYVENAFGYRRFYFDRIDQSLLGQALAWVPQSTVALVINYGLANLHKNMLGRVTPLLQVHDSLVFQCLTVQLPNLLPEILENMRVTVPYSDPLIIPVEPKASPVSWGDVEEIDFVKKAA